MKGRRLQEFEGRLKRTDQGSSRGPSEDLKGHVLLNVGLFSAFLLCFFILAGAIVQLC